MVQRFVSTDAKFTQLANSCLRKTPTFPVARADTPTQSLVELPEHRLAMFQTEVTHPATNVATKFRQTTRHRHAAVATCDLLNATLELCLVRSTHTNLSAEAVELVTQKLRNSGSAVQF